MAILTLMGALLMRLTGESAECGETEAETGSDAGFGEDPVTVRRDRAGIWQRAVTN